MTPLDSGSGAEAYVSPAWAVEEPPISLDDAPSLAFALKLARERSGRSHADLAEATRVRKDYLIALEQGAWDRLPARAFTVGYVRAYAQALGLDEQTAADRYKAECPDRSTPLAAPVGSELDDVKPRATPWVAALAVVGVAVIGWNIYQNIENAPKAKSSDIHDPAASTAEYKTPGTPVRLSAPTQAVAGQGLPTPYNPPGMPLPDGMTDQAQLQRASLGGADIPTGAAFNPSGPVYGAEPNASAVILKAHKPALVVLRSPDGMKVVFAKQLATGEAYRMPTNCGNNVVDVSDAAAFEVYLNGEYTGPLPNTLTACNLLNSRAADQAARAQAQAQRAAAANPDEAPPSASGDTQQPGTGI